MTPSERAFIEKRIDIRSPSGYRWFFCSYSKNEEQGKYVKITDELIQDLKCLTHLNYIDELCEIIQRDCDATMEQLDRKKENERVHLAMFEKYGS